MKWSTILAIRFHLESEIEAPITHCTFHQNYDDLLMSVTPAKFCQRLSVIKSFTQSIDLTRKMCIIVNKKTIQRNHMFAIFALLLKMRFFVTDPLRVFRLSRIQI